MSARRVERIDRAGARRARHADHGDRRDAGGDVGLDRAGQLVGPHAERVVAADRPQRAPAESEHVAGARDRVVGVLRGVDGRRAGRDAVLARVREGPPARAGEARQVGERAAAREVPAAGREADQLGEPAPGDVLDLRCQARAAAEIRVERGREHGRRDARLEPGAVDERERARMRVRVRARQDLARRRARSSASRPAPARGSGTR